MQFRDIPGISKNKHAFVEITLTQVGGPMLPQKFQTVDHISIKDFLQVNIGKRFRNAEFTVEDKKITIRYKRSTFELKVA